jgi:carbonic anhydrase
MGSQVSSVCRANEAYVRSKSQTVPRGPEPSRRLVVLACMDARLDLLPALGLEVGDAHILRNAGGRVTADVLRSLVVSTHLLATREIAVIHHTGCGLEGVTDAEIASRTGVRAFNFLGFDDLVESVREDVAAIRKFASLPSGVEVWGAVYEVATGALDVVVPPTG